MRTDSITIALQELKKFGYDILTFNSSKSRWGSGTNGHPDHEIIGNGILVYIEVKRKGDKLRPKQISFAEKIKTITDKKDSCVYYFEIHQDKDAMDIIHWLINRLKEE